MEKRTSYKIKISDADLTTLSIKSDEEVTYSKYDKGASLCVMINARFNYALVIEKNDGFQVHGEHLPVLISDIINAR